MNKVLTILAAAFGFLLGVIVGPWLWPPELLRAFSAETAQPQAALAPAEPVPPPPPPPAPPPEPETELSLKGVFVGGDASRALIAYGKEMPRPYKPDDKLPDGSVLKAINQKDVELEKDGETYTLLLERGTPSSEPAVTEEPAEPEEESPVTEEPPEGAPATAVESPEATNSQRAPDQSPTGDGMPEPEPADEGSSGAL